jgi:Predicted permease, DMT superfamily
MGIMPIAVAVLAHFFTHDERLNLPRAIGVVTGFAGLIVLVGWEALRGLGSDAIAQLAILGGAICYAVTTIFVRRHGRGSGRDMALAAMICGTLLMVPTALVAGSPAYATFSVKSMMALGVLGVFSTAIATLLYFRLLKTIGAMVFSQVNYMIPMMGVFWGVVLLHEQPGWREAFALVCVISGITLVNMRSGIIRK